MNGKCEICKSTLTKYLDVILCVICDKKGYQNLRNKKCSLEGTRKEYYENNKKKFKQHSKDYYENNKEKINQKIKEYYEKNKDYLSEKITCDCGLLIRRDGINKHKKTKLHFKKVSLLHKSV